MHDDISSFLHASRYLDMYLDTVIWCGNNMKQETVNLPKCPKASTALMEEMSACSLVVVVVVVMVLVVPLVMVLVVCWLL